MAKSSGLASALKADEQLVPVQPAPATPRNGRKRNTKRNLSMVGAEVDPRFSRTLRIIAAEQDTTNKALIEEALNMLFAVKGHDRIPLGEEVAEADLPDQE